MRDLNTAEQQDRGLSTKYPEQPHIETEKQAAGSVDSEMTLKNSDHRSQSLAIHNLSVSVPCSLSPVFSLQH